MDSNAVGRNPPTRTAFAALAVVTAIFVLAACGGSDETSAVTDEQVAATQTVPATPTPGQTIPATTTPGTTTPGRTTPGTTTPPAATGRTPQPDEPTSGKPPNGTQPKAKRPASPKRKTNRPPVKTSKPRPPAAPATPTGVKDPPGPNPPLDCLKQAGLADAIKRSEGLWAANARGGEVLVDGPYMSASEAQESAASLEGVTRAEPGGVYVVSGALQSDIGSEISAVARCLKDKS